MTFKLKFLKSRDEGSRLGFLCTDKDRSHSLRFAPVYVESDMPHQGLTCPISPALDLAQYGKLSRNVERFKDCTELLYLCATVSCLETNKHGV